LLDYYTTHRHEFEGIKDLQQPIIEAQLLPGLINRLDSGEIPTDAPNNFLVPEMCHLSSIPTATFRTALIIPSIIWHIENVLVAKELNLTLFQGQIRDDLLMHALCAQMARRTFNYERLEFLGECFVFAFNWL
jgi:endoribonuclease Dicer